MPDSAVSQVTVFAETNFRNQRRKFGIKIDDRRRHMYLVGKTGMGKSTVLENMFINDIRAGHGVAIVDPHGDLAEKVLNYIPSERINDVIYFNPSDTNFPLAFNILESIGEDYKHLVAYGLVGVFKKIWADSWGPRMEYILTNTILGLLDYPGSTLLGVMRMLVDKAYRKKVVAKITDPVVKTFWTDEYANYSEKFRSEAIAPIQNKVGQFLSSSIIRNIVGQSKSTIEMRDVMDNRKILIMNLAKGRIGEENSALLGAMMITKLQIAAMSRVDIAEIDRKDFYLYVDEFQNFATDSFAGILSEARKYRLCLIMAHQYLEQLGDEVKAAVFGNVGTLVVFRVGATDATEMEPEFGPQFVAQDLINLKKFTFCIRLMIDGVATEPFSGQGLPPISGATNVVDKVVKVSRERYAHPKAMVEEKILRWSGVDMGTANVVSDVDEDDDTSMEIVAPVAEIKVTPEPTEEDKLNAQIDKPLAFGGSNHLIPEDGREADVPVAVEPEKSPVAVAIEPEARPETDLGSTVGVINIEDKPIRPKINFIQTTIPDEPVATAEPETTSEPVVTVVTIDEDNEAVSEDDMESDTEEDVEDLSFDSEPETKPAPKPPVAQPVVSAQPRPTPAPTPIPTPAAPPITAKSASMPPAKPMNTPVIAPKPVQAPVTQSAAQSIVQPPSPSAGGLSLSALRDGNAPRVQFGGGSNNPTGEQNAGQPGDPNRKKRKRKRKRGGAGSTEGGAAPVSPTATTTTNANAFPNPVLPPPPVQRPAQPAPIQTPRPPQAPMPSQPQAKPQPQPLAPAPQPRPTPMPMPQPVSQPIPRPSPVPTPQPVAKPAPAPVAAVPKPSPAPSSAPDSTKVNLSDLL